MMPILTIRIVQNGKDVPKTLSQSIADAAGRIFQSKPNGAWVTIEALPIEHYAENGGAQDWPIFVDAVLGQWPDPEVLRRQASELASAVAEACMRPVDNVHILFAPPAKGRIAFGGKLT